MADPTLPGVFLEMALKVAAEGAAEEARTKAFNEVIAYCRDRAAGLRAEASEAGCEMEAELLLRADECAFLARAFRWVLNGR